MGVWAVVPVKELDRAKERLAPVLPPERRRALMLAMLEDVLTALAATAGLSGLAVVTVDAAACRLAARYGARIIETGARDGHSGAVAAAARLLAVEGSSGMLTLPGDIPLVTPAEITQLLAAHRPSRQPARDQVQIWPVPLALRQALPVLPLALRHAGVVPVDLDETYLEACRRSRLLS